MMTLAVTSCGVATDQDPIKFSDGTRMQIKGTAQLCFEDFKEKGYFSNRLCNDWTTFSGEEMRSAIKTVNGYTKLLQRGVDISSIAQSQARAIVNYYSGESIALPSELVKQVDNNSVAFEQKYSGKFIYVTGSVNGINPDSVQISNKYLFYNRRFDTAITEEASVGCSVLPSFKKKLVNLNTGDNVVAVGRVEFRSGGILEPIILKECIWVKQPAGKKLTLSQARKLFS